MSSASRRRRRTRSSCRRQCPTSGRASLDLMMPTWSPGYYRVEDYAANVRDVSAATLDGQPLAVEKTNGNHWRVDTRGERVVKLSYRVFCNQRTVTTNYVDADYGVFNGAPTFITLAENARRPHDVRIELPPGWTAAMTGLDDAPGGRAESSFAPPTTRCWWIRRSWRGSWASERSRWRARSTSWSAPATPRGGTAIGRRAICGRSSRRTTASGAFCRTRNTCSCCCSGPAAAGSNIATRISRR